MNIAISLHDDMNPACARSVFTPTGKTHHFTQFLKLFSAFSRAFEQTLYNSLPVQFCLTQK